MNYRTWHGVCFKYLIADDIPTAAMPVFVGRWWRLVHVFWVSILRHSWQQLEPVSRGNPLLPTERTEPPSLQTISILLQDWQDIPTFECQLIWSLRHIVVQSLCQQCLEEEKQLLCITFQIHMKHALTALTYFSTILFEIWFNYLKGH